MGKKELTRTNLPIEPGRICRLRNALSPECNSEAMRHAIDERLAAETGLAALRELRRLGGLENAFHRARRKRK
jgi:hypothetical protein